MMKKNTKWMYWACGMISLAGALVFLWLMLMAKETMFGDEWLMQYAAGIYWYIAGAALPCMGAMGLLCAVIREIGREKAFTERNVKYMRGIAGMAFLECAYILAGVFGWSAVGLMHPGIILMALMLMLLGGGVGILAWALAGLVRKASDIRQENELTV